MIQTAVMMRLPLKIINVVLSVLLLSLLLSSLMNINIQLNNNLWRQASTMKATTINIIIGKWCILSVLSLYPTNQTGVHNVGHCRAKQATYPHWSWVLSRHPLLLAVSDDAWRIFYALRTSGSLPRPFHAAPRWLPVNPHVWGDRGSPQSWWCKGCMATATRREGGCKEMKRWHLVV